MEPVHTVASGELEQTLALLNEILKGMRFGAVELTVHDGRVVQIERREKLRLDRPGSEQRLPRQARHG